MAPVSRALAEGTSPTDGGPTSFSFKCPVHGRVQTMDGARSAGMGKPLNLLAAAPEEFSARRHLWQSASFQVEISLAQPSTHRAGALFIITEEAGQFYHHVFCTHALSLSQASLGKSTTLPLLPHSVRSAETCPRGSAI